MSAESIGNSTGIVGVEVEIDPDTPESRAGMLVVHAVEAEHADGRVVDHQRLAYRGAYPKRADVVQNVAKELGVAEELITLKGDCMASEDIEEECQRWEREE